MTAREETFGTDTAGTAGTITLDVRIGAGRVTVRRGAEVGVRIEADPSEACSWSGGVSAILGRIEAHLGGESGSGFGGFSGGSGSESDDAERVRRAVEAATVEWSASDRTLRVASPSERTLRSVPLTITLTVPDAPTLRVRAGAADVRAADPVGETEIETTGEGDLAVVSGRSAVRCGAGDVRIGTSAARLTVRGGAGSVVIDRVVGPAEITTGAGTVRLVEVHGDVAVRLTGGNVEVVDVAAGDLELTTGAGSVHVGLREGVDAHLDLRSTAGRARSDLPVRSERGEGGSPGAPVRVRARTGAGDVLVTTASPATAAG